MLVFWFVLLPTFSTSSLDDALYQISQLQKSIVVNTTDHMESQQSEITDLAESMKLALKRIDDLEENLSGADAQIYSLSEELNSTRTNLTAELRKVETDVAAFETDVSQVIVQVRLVNKDVSDLTDKVCSLASTLNITDSKLTTVELEITNTTTRVSELTGTVDNISHIMTSLKQEVQKTETKLDSVSSGLDRVIHKVSTLDKEVSKSVKVDSEGRVPSSVMPGSYSSYTLEDVQWQSLHMAAAAGCAGSEGLRGSGNKVVPAREGESCWRTCSDYTRKYLSCLGTVTVGGVNKHLPHRGAAGYYHHTKQCTEKQGSDKTEGSWLNEDILKSIAETKIGFAITYCCCSSY